MARVCVVGAGVVGLSTATFVQEHLGVGVTLVADRFYEETTSVGAAGIFTPGHGFKGPTPEITKQWVEEGFAHYRRLHASPLAARAGVKEISGYRLAKGNEQDVRVSIEHLIDFRLLTPQEVASFPGDFKYGSYLTTLLVENKRYLPFLMDKFKASGGEVRVGRVESLDELGDEFDVVCNCSGLGAAKLCQDPYMAPVRGQVFQVEAPWIKEFIITDMYAYVFPGFGHVTVGGTRDYGCYDLTPDPYTSRAIWDRVCSVVPALGEAKVLREWVGLRPHRAVVRVEREQCTSPKGRTYSVVHNYGHGSYGVMGSAGTSMHAATLVEEALKEDLKHGVKARL